MVSRVLQPHWRHVTVKASPPRVVKGTVSAFGPRQPRQIQVKIFSRFAGAGVIGTPRGQPYTGFYASDRGTSARLLTLVLQRYTPFPLTRGFGAEWSDSQILSPRPGIPQMLVKVVGRCAPQCGVAVKGEVDTESREFIHRFSLPAGAEDLVKTRQTEVDGIRLMTFGPDAREWVVECPICRRPISTTKAGA